MSGWIAYINVDWHPAQCFATNFAQYNFTRVLSDGDIRHETYTRVDVLDS